jgi:WD40 repeat protein
VTAVAMADQGRWIVSAGADGTLRIWNTGSGALVRTIEPDEGAATALAVDDRRALTGHKGGAIVLWDLDRAEKLAVLQHRAPISSLAFTADPNRFFAASQDGAVALFDIRSPNTPAPLSEDAEGGARMIALARAGGLLVTGGYDRSIRLWRTDSHNLARTWRTSAEGITALDIAPGGRTIASAAADGTVRLWTTSSSRVQRTLKAHEGRVTALAFAPDNGMLATAGEDGVVKLWNLRSGRSARTLRGHTGPVRAVSFSSDGLRVISAGQDGTIRIWSTLATPKE